MWKLQTCFTIPSIVSVTGALPMTGKVNSGWKLLMELYVRKQDFEHLVKQLKPSSTTPHRKCFYLYYLTVLCNC